MVIFLEAKFPFFLKNVLKKSILSQILCFLKNNSPGNGGKNPKNGYLQRERLLKIFLLHILNVAKFA